MIVFLLCDLARMVKQHHTEMSFCFSIKMGLIDVLHLIPGQNLAWHSKLRKTKQQLKNMPDCTPFMMSFIFIIFHLPLKISISFCTVAKCVWKPLILLHHTFVVGQKWEISLYCVSVGMWDVRLVAGTRQTVGLANNASCQGFQHMFKFVFVIVCCTALCVTTSLQNRCGISNG